MRKALSIMLIVGLAFGSYGIFENSVTFLEQSLGFLQDAKIVVMGESFITNQSPTLSVNNMNSPIKKTYQIQDNDGTILYETDGFNIIYELLKNEIPYKEWNIIGYERVTPLFNEKDLADSILSYGIYLYEFLKSPVFDNINTADTPYYYSVVFRDEIENAYLKAFEGQTIFIKTGALDGTSLPNNICTIDGYITEVNNPVFGIGPFRIKVTESVTFNNDGNELIWVFSLFSLVPSDVKFTDIYPVKYPDNT